MADLMAVRLDSREWEKSYAATAARLTDMTPIMAAAGLYVEGSVKRTLSESGSPPGSFAPLSPASGRPGGKPLLNTGQTISGGIHVADVRPDHVAVASGFKYSAVHQFGATITIKSAKMLAWQAGGKWHFAKEVTIPARPFMVFRPEDPLAISNIARLSVEQAFDAGDPL